MFRARNNRGHNLTYLWLTYLWLTYLLRLRDRCLRRLLRPRA